MSPFEGGPARARARLFGDEAELFRDFNPKLVRILRHRVGGSPDIVEDACAFAWQQFVQHQPDRDRNWRAWLLTTAEREAWRLSQSESRHVSIDDREGIGSRSSQVRDS